MANVTDSNPIVIDTVAADVDIAALAVGLSTAPFFIKKVLFTGGTAADTVRLANARGEVVADITIATGVEDESIDFSPAFHSQGLKVIDAGTTITSGKVLIYLA